jgi:hypothetical protein
MAIDDLDCCALVCPVFVTTMYNYLDDATLAGRHSAPGAIPVSSMSVDGI